MRGSFAFIFAAVASLVFAAPPPKLSSPVGQAQCDKYSNGEGFKALCAPLFSASGALLYQTNSVNTRGDQVLKTVLELIPATNPVGKLAQLITTGIVSNALYSTNSVQALAALLQNATPQCKCDLSSCYSSLNQAAMSRNLPTEQAACAQSQYNCGAYYSKKEIDTAVPGCAAYSGPTSE